MRESTQAQQPPMEVFTTGEAARYLRVSTRWLELGRAEGYGPRFIQFGRLIRYRKTDIDEYLADHIIDDAEGGSA